MEHGLPLLGVEVPGELFHRPHGSSFPAAPDSCLKFFRLHTPRPQVWRAALQAFPRLLRCGFYSHSMVAGGLEVTSYTTRVMEGTSRVMRAATVSSSSWGSRAQSAVMPSSLVTTRTAHAYP